MILMKKIIHLLSILCYIGIGIYSIACIPNIFGYKPLIVMTGSMEPVYKVGSIIYYKKANIDDIKINDVITFENNNVLITHRVVNIENNKFTTKGDANETKDPMKVNYEEIKGKVAKKSIPYLGNYVGFINEHMYLVYGVVFILLMEFILSNTKKSDKTKEGV